MRPLPFLILQPELQQHLLWRRKKRKRRKRATMIWVSACSIRINLVVPFFWFRLYTFLFVISSFLFVFRQVKTMYPVLSLFLF